MITSRGLGNNKPAPGPAPIWVFLDECGTHVGAPRFFVGAVVVADRQSLEEAVVQLHREVLGDPNYWQDASRRAAFAATGFHHAEDNEVVRGRFSQLLSTLNFRAHISYVDDRSGFQWDDLALNMYYSIAITLLRRYQHSHVQFVFEQNPTLNALYGRIVARAASSLSKPVPTYAVYVGTKADPALAVTDYMLAAAANKLQADAKSFKQHRYTVLEGHVANIFSYHRALDVADRRGVV